MQAMFDDGFIQYSENALLLTGALTIKTFTLLINVSLNKSPPTEIGNWGAPTDDQPAV